MSDDDDDDVDDGKNDKEQQQQQQQQPVVVKTGAAVDRNLLHVGEDCHSESSFSSTTSTNSQCNH